MTALVDALTSVLVMVVCHVSFILLGMVVKFSQCLSINGMISCEWKKKGLMLFGQGRQNFVISKKIYHKRDPSIYYNW
jgi:hypothetical protein